MGRASAEGIAAALHGRRAGTGWVARCPAHTDREPSLSLCDTDGGRVLVHCHAGCSQGAVISALERLGLWSQTDAGPAEQTPRVPVRNNERERTAGALKIWCASRPAAETPVQSYLGARGLRIALPYSIRFHCGLAHPSGGRWPTMVALVTREPENQPVAIHRTYLTRDGRGKAPVQPCKMMLGPCRGGAVRLAPPSEPLMIGEGIETCLAAMQATGHAAWAALSTSGLRCLELPRDVRDIILLADGDAPGEAAALAAADRWSRQGRRVRIARAPEGTDFNDLLKDPHSSCAEKLP